MQDIFFISFQESNAETNWQRLREFHPQAKRIHGVQGIDRVHVLCDSLATTEHFWTVDGDNWLLKPLTYNHPVAKDLIMFMAQDPVIDVATPLGAVKLWTRGKIINPTMNQADFTLNATANKILINDVYSITAYNTTPYDAWRAAFRHSVKLMSVIFKSRPNAKNIDEYIARWRSTQHMDNGSNNASWCYRGYLDAVEYVRLNDNDMLSLNLINNYAWLNEYFDKYKNTDHK
jgi:hypothetical protein